jgi:hypothetical protein
MDETSLHKLLDSALAGRPPMGPVAHNALRAGLKLRRRRRIQGAAGGAAAAAIIAAALPATIGILGHTSGPAAGHRPSGLGGAPKFFAGVTPVGQQAHPATVVNIYRSATGQVVGSIRPPKPYHDFVAVSRLGGDRTFVAAVITAFSTSSSSGCTSHLFQFSIDGRGHPSGLRPLSVPQVSGLVAELVSSADGKAVAFTASGCVPQAAGMINLASRQTTTWIVPHRDHIPVGFGSLSLTEDGSRLGFVDGPAGGRGPTNVYVLPTDSPSGPLMRHATKVLHVPTRVLRVALSNNGSQAYVETFSPHGGAVVLSQYSTTTGHRVRLVGQLSPGGRGSAVFSVTVDAAGKHLLAYGDTHRLKAVNLTTGHQASITVAQIPNLDTAYNTAAW